MVTRQIIDSGAYLQHFESLPDLWTLEQIDASLEATLQARPADATSTWIFAYGSLIWNPMIEFDKRMVATLHGWQRSFCLQMTVGRASPERPGRMLALRPGGHTGGIALQLRDTASGDALRAIWIREMVLGSYRPTWAPVTLEDGSETHAIAFVADESREQFQPDSSVETVAPLIGCAAGPFGSNAEYLFMLHAALAECGVSDPYVDAIVREIERSPLRDACGER
ncbi:gamma-glutamylcyclotransferase [Burkholderia sp. Ac-20365]|uniref:gamma-glutamylcyclotransferase n=1 Tax=Burkholderia sp. Ac-20365 TaxID=2703897 RepID=UPI00197B7B5D|nr:gamma-glutamylcyclotransferase [Burkholderia sp. Ac-20365]MBN3765245.1 gamma-glutamylcyclotransferase [Burkholderia sp. Ac-20365]